MIATLKPTRVSFKEGQRVWFTSLAGTRQETTVICVADGGTSVCCKGGLFLPMRLYGVKWGKLSTQTWKDGQLVGGRLTTAQAGNYV